jgi:hypothetical protein
MPHDEVAVSRLLPDQVNQAAGFFLGVGVGVDEDRVVLKALGRCDV